MKTMNLNLKSKMNLTLKIMRDLLKISPKDASLFEKRALINRGAIWGSDLGAICVVPLQRRLRLPVFS